MGHYHQCREQDRTWLINRVKELTEALEYYEQHSAWCLEKPGMNKESFEGAPFIADHGNVARKALAGSKTE